jgi:hypothetical protein
VDFLVQKERAILSACGGGMRTGLHVGEGLKKEIHQPIISSLLKDQIKHFNECGKYKNFKF